MERVAFLIESTGERLGCLLNPESLVIKRAAGVRPRRSANGALSGAALTDDPLLYTGGGSTEMTIDLLFDVTIAGSSIEVEDVRDLTGRLWALAENVAGDDLFGRPPMVRFVWGKFWNILGIVAAVAERLEYFTPAGAPRRSWLRMRFVRVGEEAARAQEAKPPILPAELPEPGTSFPPDQVRVHEIISPEPGVEQSAGVGERLDEIAHRYFGNASLWRWLARFNFLDDPLHLRAGSVLQIPPVGKEGPQ